MVVRKIVEKLKKRKKEEESEGEEIVEVKPLPSEERKVYVKIEKLKDFSDTNRIQDLLREGYIVFVNIKEMKERDLSELKRCVDKLKRTVLALNGDIVGVEEDFIILTPGFARIER